MAQLKFKGVDMALSKMDELSRMIPERGAQAVRAGAEVLAAEMARRHPVRTGNTKAHMRIKNPVAVQDGYKAEITWDGKNAQGTRYAAIAFITEYGRSNQAAQPFIRPAQEAVGAEVQEAMKAELLRGV